MAYSYDGYGPFFQRSFPYPYPAPIGHAGYPVNYSRYNPMGAVPGRGSPPPYYGYGYRPVGGRFASIPPGRGYPVRPAQLGLNSTFDSDADMDYYYDVALGLNQSEIKDVSTVAFYNLEKTDDDAKQDDPAKCCSICLDEFADGVVTGKLRCGHTFHQTCLENWLKIKPTCPHCRFNVRSHNGRQ